MPTMRPRISSGPSPASSTSRVASSRLGSRGRVARQASAALICWPLTPRAMIGASSPARMAWTMKVSSRVSPNAGTTTATIRPTRCVAWAGRQLLSRTGQVEAAQVEQGPGDGGGDDRRDRHDHGGEAQDGFGVAADGGEGPVQDLAEAQRPERDHAGLGRGLAEPRPLAGRRLPVARRPGSRLLVAGLAGARLRVAGLAPPGPAGRIRLPGSRLPGSGWLSPGLAGRSLPGSRAARAVPATGREPWLGRLGLPVPWRVRRRTVCHGSPSRHAAAELLADSRAGPRPRWRPYSHEARAS